MSIDIPKARHFNIKTDIGEAIADILNEQDRRQVNVYQSPNGIGLFAVFPSHMDDGEIRQALMPVLVDADLEGEQNITERVPGALVAGTVTLPKVADVKFGNATVSHAEEAQA